MRIGSWIRSRDEKSRSSASGAIARSAPVPRLGLLLALFALFVALVALSVASGSTTPGAVVSQVKAKRCATAQVGAELKAVDCRGPRGRRGRRGPHGAKGDRGVQGVPGSAGKNGVRGFQGPQGAKGAKGDPCSPSDAACKGPKGDPCDPSDAACKGPKGDPCDPSDAACKGPQGDQGPPGPSDAYYAAQAGSKNIEGQGKVLPGFGDVVVSETVPAGSYAVAAKANLANIDDDDEAGANCFLYVAGSIVDGTPDFNLNERSEPPDSAQATLEYTFTAGSDTLIEVNCGASGGDRVDALRASITATKVGATH